MALEMQPLPSGALPSGAPYFSKIDEAVDIEW